MKNLNSFAVTQADCSIIRNIRGQGLTEYAIILSLVAVAAIGATSYFGDAVKASFVALGSELTGGTEYDMNAATQTALQKAEGNIEGETTLRNYRD